MKSTTCALVLAIIIGLFNSATKTQELDGCEDFDALISGDRYRVAGHLFSASSYLDEEHLPMEARLSGGEGWCSTVLVGSSIQLQEPWLEVYFGVDVIAHVISIFGNVSEYRVQFTTSADEELRFLTDSDTAKPKLFTAPGSVANATLGTPLLADRIRIAPTAWTSNPLCLQMEVYGCPLDPGCANESNLYDSPDLDLLSPDNVLYSDGQALPGLLEANRFTCFPGKDPLPTITLNFSQPVLITRAVTLHLITLTHGNQEEVTYVDEYTIATSSDGENFTTYSDPSGEAEILTDKVNAFWEPVQTEQFLKFTITHAVVAIGQVCWYLELYGCTALEVDQSSGFPLASTSIIPLVSTSVLPLAASASVPPLAASASVLPLAASASVKSQVPLVFMSIKSQVPFTSVLKFPSPTPSLAATPSDPIQDADVILQRDFLVLEIILPFALSAIVIVVFVNFVGVAYCIHLNRATRYKLKLLSPASVHYCSPQGNCNRKHEKDNTIKVLHNALYNSQESIPDLCEENHCGINVPNFSYESVQFTACRKNASGAGSRRMQQYATADISSPQGYEVPVSPGVSKAISAMRATSTVSATEAAVTNHHAYESIRLGGKCITKQPLLKAGNAPGHPSAISQDDSEYELMESMQPRSEPCITAC